jgi:hypothetical protein
MWLVLLVALSGVDGCDRSSTSDQKGTADDSTGDSTSSDEPAGGTGDTIKSNPDGPRNNLDAMQTTDLTINGHTFHVWLATDNQTRQTGLKNVEEHELARRADGSYRGMLFVFEFEHPLSFWMQSTIIPLDIAYIRTDGMIVKTYTMAPLETRTYPSIEYALCALETQAGLLKQLGIKEGDTVEIPDSVLKRSLR